MFSWNPLSLASRKDIWHYNKRVGLDHKKSNDFLKNRKEYQKRKSSHKFLIIQKIDFERYLKQLKI